MRGAPQTFGDDSLYVENKLHYSSIKAKGSQDISNIMVSVLESVIIGEELVGSRHRFVSC